MDTSVEHQPDHHRYVISVDGHPVGLTSYLERGTRRVFVHTEVDPGHEGQGLARVLVEAALTATRADGRRIVATCPYVARYLTTHHQFDDIVDAPPAAGRPPV